MNTPIPRPPAKDEAEYVALLDARKKSVATAALIAAKIAGIPATDKDKHRAAADLVLDQVGIPKGTEDRTVLTGIVLDHLSAGGSHGAA